jgi:hypothetical protein
MKLQKLGGVAAIALLCAYIVYASINLFFLPSVDPSDPSSIMAGTMAATGQVYLKNLLIFMFCIFSLAMFVALYERMHNNVPYLSLMMLITMSAATAIGIAYATVNIVSIRMLVPVRDLSAFRAFWAVTSGLGTAAIHISDWSYLFLGCAILKSRAYSRVPGWLFVIFGILSIPGSVLPDNLIPALTLIVLVMFITAFIWVAIAMLRQKTLPSAGKLEAAI